VDAGADDSAPALSAELEIIGVSSILFWSREDGELECAEWVSARAALSSSSAMALKVGRLK